MINLDVHFESKLLSGHLASESKFRVFCEYYFELLEHFNFNEFPKLPSLLSHDLLKFFEENNLPILVRLASLSDFPVHKDFPFYKLSVKLRNDVTFVKQVLLVCNKLDILQSCTLGVKNLEFMKEIVQVNGAALQYASYEIKKDKEIALLAVKQNYNAFEYVSENLKKDRDVIEQAVKKGGLQYGTSDMKDSKELVLQAIGENMHAFEYASQRLKQDEDVVLAAVSYTNYQIIPTNLRYSRSFCLKFVKKIGFKATSQCSESLMSDPSFVLELLDLKCGKCTDISLPKSLMNDRSVALKIIQKHPFSVLLCPNDRELVIEAVKRDISVLPNVAYSLRRDFSFGKEMIDIHPDTLLYLDAVLRENVDLLLYAVKKDGMCIRFVMPSNKEVVREAVKQNPEAIQFASSTLKKDEEFMLEMMEYTPLALRYASFDLRVNKEFVAKSVMKNEKASIYADYSQDDLLYNALGYSSWSLKHNREFVLNCVKKNGLSLQHASNDLKSDKEIVTQAIMQNPESLEYSDLSYDKEFVLQLIQQNKIHLTFRTISDTLKSDETIVLAVATYDPTFMIAFNLDTEENIIRVFEDNPSVLRYVREPLSRDKSFVRKLLLKNPMALQYVRSELLLDAKFIFSISENNFKKIFENIKNCRFRTY
ncbi:hypothetical protein C9374_007805 [Naegleria lovaniensis]|uniref:DUF4116 domain-containing protein n=1 Tax=Naegleria lovaniensis TaxID=51637 RepID=A0AA88KGF5_NAELO|nr:uncharacterized protein C9374_007805 [Naegleria lovaniensis]KAG2379167.1 hypothetical protein C9374_007805 [Naegleria lovaniensis]